LPIERAFVRSFFTDTLAALANKVMILDWHHLEQKCLDLSSRICQGKTAKAQLLQRLYRLLICARQSKSDQA
jgi:hypothetical protein